MSAAVLVLAFNRPNVVKRVFEALAAARPRTVYINIDGPRAGVVSDDTAVRQVRRVAEGLEWPCPVTIRSHDSNIGLGEGVVGALDWFFSHEPEGVVLEDDVLIEPKSLTLATELLTEFRHVSSVGSISLFNPVPARYLAAPQEDLWYSRIVSTQYWATWSDRWQSLAPSLEDWENRLPRRKLVDIGGSKFADFLIPAWRQEVREGGPKWEGRWMATHWFNDWRVLTTTSNYCLHLGFSQEASNSHEQPSWYPTKMESWHRSGEIKPPMSVDRAADLWRVNQRYGLSRTKILKRWVGRRIPWFRRAWRSATVRSIH